jgi:hypothetical protein
LAAAVLGAAVLVYFAMRPEAAPKVFGYIQLTHDGQRKQLVATDKGKGKWCSLKGFVIPKRQFYRCELGAEVISWSVIVAQ